MTFAQRTEYCFEAGDETLVVTVEPAGDGFAITIDGVTSRVAATIARPGVLHLSFEGGPRLTAWVAGAGPQRWVALDRGPWAGCAFELSLAQPAPRKRAGPAEGNGTLEAQMPGVVRRVLARAGETVMRGQTLVLLEAMKMEIRVNAPYAGEVLAVAVAEGQAVERGQKLVELRVKASAA